MSRPSSASAQHNCFTLRTKVRFKGPLHFDVTRDTTREATQQISKLNFIGGLGAREEQRGLGGQAGQVSYSRDSTDYSLTHSLPVVLRLLPPRLPRSGSTN